MTEGDRVPADAELLSAHDSKVDKSLLTGESVPVRKAAATANGGIDRNPAARTRRSIYSGSLIVHGRGVAQSSCHRRATPKSVASAYALSQMNLEETRLRRGKRNLARRPRVI